MEVQSTKLKLSETSMDQTVQIMVSNMSHLTEALDELWGDIKEAEG